MSKQSFPNDKCSVLLWRISCNLQLWTAASLVDFFNGWALRPTIRSSACSTGTWETPRESPGTTRHSTSTTASSLVQLGDNRHADFLQLFLFVFKLVLLSQLNTQPEMLQAPKPQVQVLQNGTRVVLEYKYQVLHLCTQHTSTACLVQTKPN